MTNIQVERGELVPADEMVKQPVKSQMIDHLRFKTDIILFRNDVMILKDEHYVSMSSELFANACYQAFGQGINKSRIADIEHYYRSSAREMDHVSHLIAFGDKVWDMENVEWSDKHARNDCVFRTRYRARDGDERIRFIMDLACNDEGVYDDIMKAVAPLILKKKPTGVIWFLGNGANGKSSLVRLIYKIFEPYLTELTVKQLEDERDTPSLNGKLGNVCKESSEGFIEDTRIYKCIGTHEPFKTHKFHTQDMIDIEGNVHHIMSTNNMPTFGDKSYGARRRTLVIPFKNRFKPDETFEDRTFTDEFVERFIGEMVKYAKLLKKQNYEYLFSETTTDFKEKYDTDANTAQTYMDELWGYDVRGFINFGLLKSDYENWCLDNGYKYSSINVLRKATDELGFRRTSVRDDFGVRNVYLVKGVSFKDVKLVPGLRKGLYQLSESDKDELIYCADEEAKELMAGW